MAQFTTFHLTLFLAKIGQFIHFPIGHLTLIRYQLFGHLPPKLIKI